ncbi:HAD family phosphatase [Rhizorhabdus dicambivorans]|uniref:HAD family phosphatase n=1 Tax=Rhizorhabdus dicambivorans TaxID=1850238 RepID=A0A2A4FVE8_9SPHN|nr:HAD family phosphatase [Rhizorhabdus dicambivorans]ATE63517.1 HAD family phosphatase [Rhizorhabdus dicambivorans]PCE41428.1 HAD family phosphatase [Rhizorhabdus dicambivorans]
MLYDWNLRQFFEKLVPARELELFLRDVVNLDWHSQHDAGRPFAETSAELIAGWPRFADAIRAFGPRFSETVTGLLPGMGDIVRDLHGRGVPLYAITNFSHEFWPPFRAREAAVFDLFDDIVVSGDEKLIKPDRAIYHLALARFGLTADEAIFIDDRAENVIAAEACGIHGHVFRDAADLRARLESLRLL